MRKFVPIMIITAAMLVSCGRKESEPTVKLAERFTINAEITDGEFTACAEMKRMPEGWEIRMTAPQTIEGMEFELTETECMVRFTELSYPAATETLLDSSPLLLTARALDSCVMSGNEGEVKKEPYLLTFSEGNPSTLQIGSVTAVLSDYHAE